MKKIFLLAFLYCIGIHALYAQESKQTKNYLPEEGDWAIGIDVVPVLKYIGNAFNGNTDNSLESLGGTPFTKNSSLFTLTPDVSIVGKYMLTDEWGIRANLGLKLNSSYHREYVRDDKAYGENGLSEEKLIDKGHYTANGMSLALGAEYRKGNRRIQGVFGMGALFAFQKSRYTYDWANQITSINQRPSIAFDYEYDNNNYRTLKEYSNDGKFYTGITGSAGVEWFICPKISLGAEVNLVAYYLFGTQSYRESEGYNPYTEKVEVKTDLKSPGDRGFYVGTESLGGSLNMTFYF